MCNVLYTVIQMIEDGGVARWREYASLSLAVQRLAVVESTRTCVKWDTNELRMRLKRNLCIFVCVFELIQTLQFAF